MAIEAKHYLFGGLKIATTSVKVGIRDRCGDLLGLTAYLCVMSPDTIVLDTRPNWDVGDFGTYTRQGVNNHGIQSLPSIRDLLIGYRKRYTWKKNR